MKYNEQEPVDATNGRKYKGLRYWSYRNMFTVFEENMFSHENVNMKKIKGQ